MINELPVRNQPFTPFRFKRFYEVKGNKIHIWGKCEVTGQNFEMFVPTDEFYVYLQGFKSISEALKSAPKEEREFLLSGTSPEGWKMLSSKK